MECNKHEAVRAKEIAEKKMGNNDFEAARKIALKAQNLFPELENITQLLSICDVHCAAQTGILGSDKDWYGILQVAKFADELTVKKQYRRLALYLHPDKNRFPGAEAAFKLICEANAVLSDVTKKSFYDSKIRVTVRSAPVIHMNKTNQFNKACGAPNNVLNGFGSLNNHQPSRSSFSIRQDMFLTSCPFCSVKHQHPRTLLNTMLNCQHCSKNFIGYELGAQVGPKWVPSTAQTVPLNPDMSQYDGIQAKTALNSGQYTMGVKTGVGSQWCASRKTVQPEAGVCKSKITAKVGGNMKAKEVDNNSNSTCGDAHNRETGNVNNNKNRKKGRKCVVESSDRSSDSDLEDVTIKKDLNSGPTHAHFVRRSSRKRQNVSYTEKNGDDEVDYVDVFPTALNRQQGNKISKNAGDEEMRVSGGKLSKHENPNGTVHPDFDKHIEGRGEKIMSSDSADAVVIEEDCDQDSYSGEVSDKDICICVDPEFNDFDKGRDESCFSINQLWACYDSTDGMPRFYAKLNKVSASPFKLSFTWLEPVPIDQAHMKWKEVDLPVGCGIFKLGESGFTSSCFTFSHQVLCEKGKKRGSFVIYPRVGEVWALFKDWDLNWSFDPENHRKYIYEIVEILSDFAAVDGVKVCHLDKVSGFVSLFQRSNKNDTKSFFVGPNELYKFSHRVCSYKLTGDEREGVPAGSFELDPASLPLNHDDLCYPGKSKTNTEKMNHGTNFAPPESA